MSGGVLELYEQSLARRGFVADPSQRRAVDRLQRLYEEWSAYKARRSSALRRLLVKPPLHEAMQMSMTVMFPSIFFSGFIFPRETMPWIFYAISTVLPLTYFIELMRGIVLRGSTLLEFWKNIAILALMGGALFSLCALRFKLKIG